MKDFFSQKSTEPNQIERLRTALGKRKAIMDMWKNSKDKLDASVKKMKKQYGDFADIMSGLPINEFLEESLITEKEVADGIDSLKRKIEKLTDLKADGYIK